MKRVLKLVCFLLIYVFIVSCNNHNNLRNGDIIFQISKSRQSEAIQKATNSKYSHIGIIYNNKGNFFVYEAVQPVKLTPINEWINRGENKHYVVKRLKNWESLLTLSNQKKMKNIGDKFNGKPYDSYFEWSNERIYCSELVWKIYKEALNIEIGKLKTLKSFNLEDPFVKKIMKERYGDNIPINELVISPGDMFDSNKLYLIKSVN